MSGALLLARRELSAYVRSPIGYAVIAAGLLIEGIYFYAFGLSQPAKLSAEVLSTFFDIASAVTGICAILLTMRLVAGERENHTLVLLNTAPLREREVVIGKFLAGFVFLAALALVSVYMPLLVFVNGKVSVGHVVVGYVGLLQLTAAAVAIGIFASTLANTQIVAAITAAVMLGVFFMMFWLAKAVDPPLKEVASSLALYQTRVAPTMKGILKLENVAFTVGVAYVFLLAATKSLEARRWR